MVRILILVTLLLVRVSVHGDTGAPPMVEVAEGAFEIYVVETAALDARRSVTIASDLPSNSAKIAWIIQDGAWVEAGEPVARFDPEPFREEIAKLERDHAEARANLVQAEAELQILIRRGQEQVDMLTHQIAIAELEIEQFRKADRELTLANAANELLAGQSAFEQARLDAETQRRLGAEGFGSAATLAQAEAAEREKSNAVALAKSALRLQETVLLPAAEQKLVLELEGRKRERGSAEQSHLHTLGKQQAVIASVQTGVAELASQLDQARARLSHTELAAPVSGFAVHVPTSVGNDFRTVQVGDSVWNRHGFMVLPDMSSLVADVRVREVDLGKVAVDQHVRLVPDAYPDLQLVGTVEAVGTLAERASEDHSNQFSVRIGIEGVDPRLRPGMRARAEILSRRFENVTRVPVEAVFRDGGDAVCFVWRGDRPERRLVEPGPDNGVEIVVTSGLTPGERVLLVHPDAWLADAGWASP